MFDYLSLQSSSENPTFLTILFTVLFSFLLSSIIAFTYDRTSRHLSRPTSYLQGLVLISIVAAMVMQAIGDSLARGLGMLGALAIIRFRTTLREPRNMVFMFASIAAGIACGVLGFTIAIVGTIGFCLVAFILRYSPFSKEANLIGNIRFNIPVGFQEAEKIEALLNQHCRKYHLSRHRLQAQEDLSEAEEYEFKFTLKDEKGMPLFVEAIRGLPGVHNLRFTYSDTQDEY